MSLSATRSRRQIRSQGQRLMPRQCLSALVMPNVLCFPFPQVHIRSHFIMNGICVTFRGWVDLDRLDGVASLEFDEERASIEEAILKDQIDRHKAYIRDMEKRERMMERKLAESEVSISS